MTDQPIVSKEIQDMIDGKGEPSKPPVSGNQRLVREMQNQQKPKAGNA